MTQTPVQLSLSVALKEDTTFANFLIAPANQVPVQALRHFAEGRSEKTLALWAKRGSGVTHILQACVHSAFSAGLRAQYLPIAELMDYPPEQVFEGLDELDMVCLDGVAAICGNRDWEQNVFHLFNRLKDRGKFVLLAFAQNPSILPWVLPDLKSRILGCVVYHLNPLNDDELSLALQQRAFARGMNLSEEVALFVLNRASRDAHSVFAILDRLDTASLQQQRKLTVPFVKQVLDWQ